MKTIVHKLLLLVCLLVAGTVWGDAQTNAPSGATNITDNGADWSNPHYALLEDGNLSQNGGVTNFNFLSVSNFGFTLPSGATITNIKVYCKNELGAPTRSLAARIASGSIVSSTQALSQVYALDYTTLVGLWGKTWTSAQINSSGFRVEINSPFGAGTADIDYIYTIVEYDWTQSYAVIISATGPENIKATSAGSVTGGIIEQ